MLGSPCCLDSLPILLSRHYLFLGSPLAYSSNVVSSALYIPNADNVYVGTTNGQIFQTQWNGANWTTLTALTTPRSGAYVSDLFVDPNNLSRLWATSRRVGGGRVFRSDNGGSSWLDLTTGLPGLPINAIEVDPENANRIWVAADLGVYQSLDGGNSWTDFSNGLPNMYVGDLLFHPHARVLRAGTRNRGVWEIPVDGWMTQPICAVQFTGSLQGNQTGRWFTFNPHSAVLRAIEIIRNVEQEEDSSGDKHR